MPRLVKTIDEDKELLIFADEGKLTRLGDYEINLSVLWDIICNHDSRCLDDEEDRLALLSHIVEEATGR
jgi:hypothetical protein